MLIEHDDDRQVVEHRRRELLAGHLEAAVAVDADDRRLGSRRLRADRGRDPVAHRPEPARGDERARPLGEDVLHRPHLVLADAGRDDHVVAGGQRLELSITRLRLEQSSLVAVAERELVAPARRSGAATPRARARRPSRCSADLVGELARATCLSGPTTGTSASRSFEISAGSMSRWTTRRARRERATACR